MSGQAGQVRANQKFDQQKLQYYLNDKKSLIFQKFGQQINYNHTKHTFNIQQFTHGQSNPTFLIEFCGLQMVMRKKPAGKLLKKAHLINREFQIIQALQDYKFPVPKAILYCEDESVIGTEFYLMEFVRGRIFRQSDLPTLSPEERSEVYEEMARVLALLHQIDPYSIQKDIQVTAKEYYQRQISIWSQNYKSAETEKIEVINNLIDWLPANIPIKLDQKNEYVSKLSIVHGDYKLDNIIFHPIENKIIAVLDWELWSFGSPVADLAYNCLPYHYTISEKQPLLSGIAKLDYSFYGIPNEWTYKQYYLKKMNATNEAISDKEWDFYLSFSMFRLTSIIQGVYKRSIQGNASSAYAHQFKDLVHLLGQRSFFLSQKTVFKLEKAKKKQDPNLSMFNPSKFSDRFWDLKEKLLDFMEKFVYPNEKVFEKQIKEGDMKWKHIPEILKELQQKAREQGLWNLFLPHESHLSLLEYAPLCEIMGRSVIAPKIFNCDAPNTGNMEILHMFGTEQQKKQWLEPMLAGEISSCFGMTERGTTSSDATNIACTIVKDPTDPKFYIVNGRKWWSTNAGYPDCKLAIVLGKTPNKQKKRHEQHTMILVPFDSEGVRVIKPLKVFGYEDEPFGHMEVDYSNVRVPKENILLGEGQGFLIAQGRLGPGRVHHCMRSIGLAERCYENLLSRVLRRKAFNKLFTQFDSIQQVIAKSRAEINQIRLLVLQTADSIDTQGIKKSIHLISMIKFVIPETVQQIVDRIIQVFGGEGVSQDTCLAFAYTGIRSLRIADGPSEVHMQSLAKIEIGKYKASL